MFDYLMTKSQSIKSRLYSQSKAAQSIIEFQSDVRSSP